MSWYEFKPYVSVAERRRKAEKAAKKMVGKGRAVSPVRIEGRAIAGTFWGKAWCANLESYSDYENRLPRGRTYVRNGSVIDLQITGGKIEALVQGSDLYKISLHITALPAKRWEQFTKACAGKVTNLLDLLQGRLSKEILADITAKGTGLFPAPAEIKLGCSCPDWADMCKHVAAVLYGVGARLDTKPELFFTLRGVDMQDLISAASASAAAPVASVTDDALAGADLAEIFGVEIETAPSPAAIAPREVPVLKLTPASKKKPMRKKPVRAAKPAGKSRKAVGKKRRKKADGARKS
ncbi:MAG: SWIM zinc finger family protein [Verrucomicrobia bacterium]|nr:SWIM zinc finger family protein [Verrucomicrobiota bacterium]